MDINYYTTYVNKMDGATTDLELFYNTIRIDDIVRISKNRNCDVYMIKISSKNAYYDLQSKIYDIQLTGFGVHVVFNKDRVVTLEYSDNMVVKNITYIDSDDEITIETVSIGDMADVFNLITL